MPPVRALVHIDPMAPDQRSQIDGLKRVSLLFDEIHFKVASGWRLKEEVAADPRRYKRGPKGNFLPVRDFAPFVGGYNPLDDVHPAFGLEICSWPSELRETIEALLEAGIAVRVDEAAVRQADSANRLDRLRSVFVEVDYKSRDFARLSGNPESADFTFGRLELKPLPNGDPPSELHYLQFPPVFLDSITLTETLYLAHTTGSNAVFLSPRYRPELGHRFRQFREGVKTLNDVAPEVAAALRSNARFGEVAFNVANAIVGSPLLASRTIEDLLRFRAETNDARRRFISADLAELEGMVAENAWSAEAKEEMYRFVRKKLTPDVIAYNDATEDVWRKLFGNTRTRLARVTTGVALGATAHQAGGLLGNVLPNATGMSLLLIAALAGLAKEAPGFWQDLEAAIAEARTTKRSSIAYVARLSKLG